MMTEQLALPAPRPMTDREALDHGQHALATLLIKYAPNCLEWQDAYRILNRMMKDLPA